MNSDPLRNKLLGISTYFPKREPPAGSRFQSELDYAAFLEESKQHSDQYWMETADKLDWVTPPRGIGGPMDWFPGGRLTIDTNCFPESVGADEPIISTYAPSTRKIVHTNRAQLAERMNAIAGSIRRWNLDQGDRVLVAVTPDVDALAATLACLKLGLTCVPMDPCRSRNRIPRRAKDAVCKGAVLDADSGLGEGLDVPNLLQHNDASATEPVGSVELGPMHPAIVLADSAGQLFTLPLAGFLTQAVSAHQNMLNGGKGDVGIWLTMPSHYASYLCVAFGSMLCGGRFGTLPISVWDGVSTLKIAIESTSPKTLLVDTRTVEKATGPAIEEGLRPQVRGPDTLVIDGEIVEPRLWAYLLGGLFDGECHVVQMLSRPESGGFVAGPNTAVTPVRTSSVSLPAPGIDLSVVRADRQPCETGEGGLLALKKATPGMALELQKLDAPFTIEVKARQDRAGYFWPMGEVKVERAKAKGVTIPEVEAMMVSISGVEMAAIVRYAAPSGLKKTRAFIQPSTTDTEGLIERVKAAVRAKYGEDGLADHFQLVKQLPYGRTGKLLRSVLRRLSQGEPILTDDIVLMSDDPKAGDLTSK